ncbi:PhnD/SsuA/transferrin family substrate-binding protein [Candidatus Bipolaricaulota bacterium]|nr:PhnD/SsuA/transferrin family substrate-binding protein [Candidatus Bipolaricaulota bacterium]
MSQDLGTRDRPIYLLLVPSMEAATMQAIGDKITANLHERTGLYIVMNLLADPTMMIEAFATSEGDIFGFPTTDQYIQICERTNGNVAPRLGQLLYGYPYYYSSIYARRDSGINSPEDVDGLVWCYNDTGSTSGYVLPNMLFNNKGIEVGRTVETGGHTNSMVALIEGQCDFCTGYGSPPLPPAEGPWASYNWAYGMDPEMWVWDRVTDDLYDEESRGTCKDLRRAVSHMYDLETVLREIGVVANIGPIPNDCLAFGPDFPTNVADTIVAAIQDQFNDEEMKALWGDENFYWWDAVAPIDDSFYDGYRDLLGIPVSEKGLIVQFLYGDDDGLAYEDSMAWLAAEKFTILQQKRIEGPIVVENGKTASGVGLFLVAVPAQESPLQIASRLNSAYPEHNILAVPNLNSQTGVTNKDMEILLSFPFAAANSESWWDCFVDCLAGKNESLKECLAVCMEVCIATDWASPHCVGCVIGCGGLSYWNMASCAWTCYW